MGGGQSGTTTTTQTNTPFNAAQLLDYQNKAVGLSNSNPIDYYSGQTYAPPPDLNNDSLSAANFWGNASGNNTAAASMYNQENALSGNNFITSGGALNRLNPYLGSLGAYADNNIGETGNGATILNDIAGGGWLYPQMGNINSLADAGVSGPGASALNYVAQGNYTGGASPFLSGLENATSTGAGAGALNSIANGTYYNQAQPSITNLENAGLNGPGAGALGSIAGGNYLSAESPYLSGLAGLASGGTAANSLGATASGAFLGANPYLNAQFNAAADPVITNFMRAVSPQTDSAMNAAGRFNSGALSSTQAQNQDSLAKGLGDLGANLYGNAYTNERGLMTQAAGTLGQLQQGDLTGALNAYNQGVGQIGSAATNLGNQYVTGLTSGLNAQNAAVGQMNNASTSLLNGNITSLADALSGYTNLGNLSLNAANDLANINLTGRSNALSAYGNLTGQATTAASNLGSNEVSGRNSQIAALQSAISGYNNGLGIQQNAINSTPALSALPFSDYTAGTAAGTQEQQYAQAAIQDQENRFYGNELAPWSSVQQEAGIVGGAIPGVTTTQQPYYTNPIGQAAGGLGAVASLGKLLK